MSASTGWGVGSWWRGGEADNSRGDAGKRPKSGDAAGSFSGRNDAISTSPQGTALPPGYVGGSAMATYTDSDSESENNLSGSEGSYDDVGGEEEELSWIQWFCSLDGNEYFCEVEAEYVDDDFNLTGLSGVVPFYDQAITMIRNAEPDDRYFEDPELQRIASTAELLYGLIHQRYILTRQGLQAMAEKYDRGDFGRCPRYYCNGTFLLPAGQSDFPGYDSVKLFCPSCVDLFHPPSSRYSSIDGACFGTTFPHLMLNTFPDLREPFADKVYEPRIYGFRIHKTAVNAPKMQWLRRGDPPPVPQGGPSRTAKDDEMNGDNVPSAGME